MAPRIPQTGDHRDAANRRHLGGLLILYELTGLEIAAKVDAVVQQWGRRLEDLLKIPHQFSGGQQQRDPRP
jgi:ABC-type oligopeptide transport system ATPase subunit